MNNKNSPWTSKQPIKSVHKSVAQQSKKLSFLTYLEFVAKQKIDYKETLLNVYWLSS